MSNKIVAHIVGGGASRVGDAVLKKFKEQNTQFGYCNWEFHYLDSSDVNYKNIKEPLGDLTIIGYDDKEQKVVDGSGADRKANAEVLKRGVDSYVERFKLNSREVGVFNLVIFTASGGTSSVAGPFLLLKLLNNDVNVIGLCIGDSSNTIATQNTLNTIASLDHIAKSLNKCLTLLYYNNHLEDPNNLKKGESIVNEKIQNALEVLSTFLSGDNADIDSKDMEIFIEQSRYQGAIQVPPGIFKLYLTSKEIKREEGVEPTMARTLTIKEETNHSLNFDLIHAKNGIITSEVVQDRYRESVPLIAITLANYFERECVGLRDRLKYYDKYLSSIVSKPLEGANGSTTNDLGIVL